MRLLGFVLLAVLAHTSLAQTYIEQNEKFYVGAGVNWLDTDTRNEDNEEIKFATLELIGGYKYNGFLGGEARVGVGLTDEDLAGGDVSVDYHGSVYWRPETANDVAKIYGLLGFSTISLSLDNDADELSDSQSGFSFGGGVGFTLMQNWNVNFEYRSLLDDTNEFTLVNANVDYRF